MTSHAHRVAAALSLMLAAFTPAALAQTASSSLQESLGKLRPGQLVYIEDGTGERFRGKLSMLSLYEIVIRMEGAVAGQKPFAADRITRISTVDSRRNGFLVGLAAGAVPGLLLGRTFNELCKNESPGYCPSAFLVFGGLFSLGGGWIGWEVDDLITRETPVFSREADTRPGPAARLGGSRRAVAVHVRF